MSGMHMMFLASSRQPLDTQTVTVGLSGSVLNEDRNRGYTTGLGSISDGTSNIYSGAAITSLFWSEDAAGVGSYILYIPGAANSGWQIMVIGNQELLRTDATYSSGFWSWYGYSIATQQFGNTSGVNIPVYFY